MLSNTSSILDRQKVSTRRRFYSGLVFLVLLSLITTACVPNATPSPIPAFVEKPRPKAAWEKEWDKLTVEAKNEGKAVIYYGGPAELKTDLYRAFKEEYGIDLEFVFGRALDLPPKIERERRAGLYLADIGIIPFYAWVFENR